jgi:hypothetical protein
LCHHMLGKELFAVILSQAFIHYNKIIYINYTTGHSFFNQHFSYEYYSPLCN